MAFVLPVNNFFLVALAGLGFSLSPGPSMFFIMSRSLKSGFVGGLYSSLGLALGGGIHVILATFGLSALLASSPRLFIAIQICGALYILWLGIRDFKKPLTINEQETDKQDLSPIRWILQGCFVEATNPKTGLFFISFLPQFIEPAKGNIQVQFLILGALIPLTAIPSDIFVSTFSSRLRACLIRNIHLTSKLSHLTGVILIGLGTLALLKALAR